MNDNEKNLGKSYRSNPSLGKSAAKKAILDSEDLQRRIAWHVAGQRDAVRWLASYLSLEYARCVQASQQPEHSCNLPRRTPALLVGPKGCGKTILIDAAATEAGIFHYTVNADCLRRHGYGNLDLSSVVKQANEAAGQSESGVALIHVENLDRIARCSDLGDSNPIWDFIDLLEGRFLYENADRLIVIFSGTFTGIDDIAARCECSEMGQPQSGAYSAIDESFEAIGKLDSVPHVINPTHLMRWGMYGNLASCFTDVCLLERLDVNDLRSIASGVRGSIKNRYATLFRLYGASFGIDKEASLLLAQQAERLGRGAYIMEDMVGSAVRDAWGKIVASGNRDWRLGVEEGSLRLY